VCRFCPWYWTATIFPFLFPSVIPICILPPPLQFCSFRTYLPCDGALPRFLTPHPSKPFLLYVLYRFPFFPKNRAAFLLKSWVIFHSSLSPSLINRFSGGGREVGDFSFSFLHSFFFLFFPFSADQSLFPFTKHFFQRSPPHTLFPRLSPLFPFLPGK